MWYSPHKAFLEESYDGANWKENIEASFLPYNCQFRDPMILKIEKDFWVMYATARPYYYSSIDMY